MKDLRRRLPSVGKLLETSEVRELLDRYPRTLVLDSLRAVLDEARNKNAEIDDSSLKMAVISRIEMAVLPTLRRVINATGVVLHTNLGRAPLAPAAISAIQETASGYSNLEYDLAEGGRGSRYAHCVDLLRELTGAEDALVVNNCASALVLSLAAFAYKKEAVISRGELVEIGGSFRIPDIMRASGAKLLEVGTTNRTHVDDYVRAVSPKTGAFVKVHRSNFTVTGFVADVGIERLAPVANERGIPVIHDLGSGLLISLEAIGLKGEPLAADAVSAGATLVLMSGDKLLGGPQAGLVVGKAAAIARLKRHPLARALRVDKLTIAALSATLQLYRDPANAMREIPILAMLGQTPATLETRANTLRAALGARGIQCQVRNSTSTVGAGAFPSAELGSRALVLDGNPEQLDAKLRAADVALVGRIQDGDFMLDLRSIMPQEDARIPMLLERALL